LEPLPEDVVVLSEIVTLLERRTSESRDRKTVVEVDLSDSSGSDIEEEEEEKEDKDKEKVVANPFFTDSEDSEEGEGEEQAKEKEKLVEMLYSLIKGDERASSPEKMEASAGTLPAQPPAVADSAGRKSPAVEKDAASSIPVAAAALDLFDQIAAGKPAAAPSQLPSAGDKETQEEGGESSEPAYRVGTRILQICRMLRIFFEPLTSVADPECFSRLPDPIFFPIPDPESELFPSRIPDPHQRI
jgi:hypothetical protein